LQNDNEFLNDKALVEAILFLENDAVDIRELSQAGGMTRERTEEVLSAIRTDLEDPGRALELSIVAGTVQLVPKRSLWPRLRSKYGRKRDARLSRAALETLSIVAYSQPITRGEIESLRGVSADAMINRLLEYELIREVGRKDAPGRPTQYGTTHEFLRRFGLESIADLPKLDEMEEERFRTDG
jgi:segregation and condensation protein B